MRDRKPHSVSVDACEVSVALHMHSRACAPLDATAPMQAGVTGAWFACVKTDCTSTAVPVEVVVCVVRCDVDHHPSGLTWLPAALDSPPPSFPHAQNQDQ